MTYKGTHVVCKAHISQIQARVSFVCTQIYKGYAAGTKGSEVLRPLARSTTVRAGGVLEAGFGFEVNHGGTPLGGSNPSTAAHSGL